MCDDINAIVIDNGSGICRAGFAGEETPCTVIPSYVGRLKQNDIEQNRDYYVGEQAQTKRGILALNYPIDHGIITNWDDMEKIWHHIFFDELKIEPDTFRVCISEPPLNPKYKREQMTEIMFEVFKTPGMYVALTGTLGIYAAGRAIGLMLDSGYGVSSTSPIYESYVMPNTACRNDYAGDKLTENLMQALCEKNTDILSKEVVEEIKEKMCYVALDAEKEVNIATDCNYTLPDGTAITLGNEMFRCPEVLFHKHYGIHKLVLNSIMKCDENLRRGLYNNIILMGGNTMLKGTVERLKQEITAFAPPAFKVGIVAMQDRKDAVWIGGSMLASLSTFQNMWVTKEEYEEYGPEIVHRKCIT